MTILSEYIIKAEDHDRHELKLELIADNLPAALDLTARLVAASGFPTFHLTDKQKQQHVLDSTTLATRLVAPNSISYVHTLKAVHEGSPLKLECSHWERCDNRPHHELHVDLPFDESQWRNLSQQVDRLIRTAANESLVIGLTHEVSRDGGYPFEAIRKALGLYWLCPPRLLLVDEPFFEKHHGRALWEEHGFIVTPVANSRFLLQHRHAATAGNEDHHIGSCTDLIDIHVPSEATNHATRTQDVLYKKDLELADVREYFTRYLEVFGRVRTTQIFHNHDRNPTYHRLDRDLINPNLVPEATIKRILRLYYQRLRWFIKQGEFDYEGRGEVPFAYKVVGDAIWGICIQPNQYGPPAPDACTATVSMGFYKKSLSKRRKPLPTDKEGRELVHPQTFIWWADLNVLGDRPVDSRGLMTIHLESQRHLEFRYEHDEQVIASFDRLVEVWRDNFSRASRLA